MKETARMLLALLAGSGLFLTLFFLLHWNPIVSLLLSVGAYFGLFFLLKPRPKLAGISLDGVKNGEDWAALLEGAQEDLETLERAGQEIPSPSVAKQAQELSATARRLMAYLQKNREKIPPGAPIFPLLPGHSRQAAGAIQRAGDNRPAHPRGAGDPAENPGGASCAQPGV